MKKLIFTLVFTTFVFLSCDAQQAPEGAVFPNKSLFLLKTPHNELWAAARFDVATLKKGVENDGLIEIDYIEIIQEDLTTNKSSVIERIDYKKNKASIPTSEGGLYVRDPWYIAADCPRPLVNAKQINDHLIIKVGEQPNYISHFWSNWVKTPANTRLYVKASFKITGEIGFQMGLDYASQMGGRQGGKNTEAFVSNWYNDTNGKFINVMVPDYNEHKKIEKNQYGVYADGLVFISKELVDYFNGKTVEVLTLVDGGWKYVEMTLNGDRYEFHLDRPINHYLTYCFRLNKNNYSHIPALIIDSKTSFLQNPDDIVPNYDGGYNFRTAPLPLHEK